VIVPVVEFYAHGRAKPYNFSPFTVHKHMVDSFQTSATPRANGTALHTSIVKIVSDRQGMVENPPDKVIFCFQR
jgi:hypothetical protein